MANPSRLFILRPVATALLTAAILLAGSVAYLLLPISALPQVDYPTIQILTFYPGASPDVMASSVTSPLERQFGQLPGLKQMTSTSSFGASLITLQFTLDYAIDVAEQQVQAAINAAATFLPRDLPSPPVYSKVNPADTPVLTLALTSDTLPLTKVQDLADTNLAQKISQLPGVGLVSISGGQKPAVRVQADPSALASYGLSLEDLRAVLGQANVNQAKGNLEGAKQSYTIGANDQLLTSVEYKSVVVMVMLLFLRSLSATIIPSVALPISIVGTFGIMYLLGYSLDNLSLMALTISTGFVVDDAIVMIENIARYIEAGESPLQAALKGSEQIGFTIVSLTVSLIAVLIPLLFMGDIIGRLFREFAITLSVTILVSAVVSLTLTPMMCARLLRVAHPGTETWFYRATERMFERTIAAYGRTLQWVLRHQPGTLGVTVATLVLTIILYIVAPKGFFPLQDTGVILGITEAPEVVSFPTMADRQQALARIILKDPDVASLSSFIGVDGTNMTPNSGRLQINLKPREERRSDASEIIRRLQPALAAVDGITLYMQPVQDLTVEDRVSRTQFQYSLEDADARELAEWAPRLIERLRTLPELRDVASDQLLGGLQVSVVIDRDTASRLGIQPQAIDDTLYDAFGQRQVSTIFTQLNQYHVILEVAPRFQDNPEALKAIYVKSANGTQVPLSAFTHYVTGSAPLSVNHQGQFPAVTVSFNLAPGVALGHAVNAIKAVEREIGLPLSIRAAFQGTAKAFQASLANEPLLILAALITVYIVLGVLYESYIHPITILSTLPSAGVGAILALLLCRTHLDVIALIGIILLIGIVKKNAIMMIDFALDAEREEGKVPAEAIYQACLLRFRPIMMTTMAALLGGLPLALGSGTGSELRRPLGITIVGGLLLSQLLTLYTTPVVYLYFDRLAKRFGGAPAAGPLPAEAAAD